MKNIKSNFPHYLNSEKFHLEVKRRMKNIKNTPRGITLVSLDFDNFNYINDLFGYEVGDLTLERLTSNFSLWLNNQEVFSRIHADHFVFCLESNSAVELLQRFFQMTNFKKCLSDILPPHYNLVVSGGVISVSDNVSALSSLLDKANYARKRAKGNSTTTFRFYDEKMESDVQWQKIVTCTMEQALKNREFEMYLQPKVSIKTNELVGAEALVRWSSPEYGMIFPNQFIPIMEQNGFIRQLDFFMLEEACRFLNENKKAGVKQLGISVNFSKAHLSTENLVEKIFCTVNRAGVSPHLIEIEFTESLSFDSFGVLVEIVTDLKLLGFKVSLDDFGNSYSSLTCLKDLPFDIIKIDKGFLNSSTNTEKGKVIVSKIVELIKSLRMVSVMEGVESKEQLEFLKKMSCDIGQGYYYAKPLPVNSYIDYIEQGSAISDIEEYVEVQKEIQDKSYLCVIPQEFEMDNWELYILGKNIDMGLMKGYLDGESTVQYVNDCALEYLGYTRQEFREVFNNSIIAFTHPDDAEIVKKNSQILIETGKSLEFRTRAIRKDGKIIVLQGRSSCVIDNQGRPVGLYAFQDVTEELEQTDVLNRSLEDKIEELNILIDSERNIREAFRLSEERYRLIVEQSNDIMFEWDFISDTITFSNKYEIVFGMSPICNQVTINPSIRSVIHPDDLEAFERWIERTFKKSGCSEAQYRIKSEGNDYYWTYCRSTGVEGEDGVICRAIGVFSNINTQKNEIEALTAKSQCDPLTKLLNKSETQIQIDRILHNSPSDSGALFIIDIDNFKGLNDNLGHQMGDVVLTSISDTLQKIFRKDDIIGRIGGDEFAVYLYGGNEKNARLKGEQLRQALRSTYYGSTTQYNISASIGISLYPEHGHIFDELYRVADIALYESKGAGKDLFTIYRDDMTGSLADNRTPVEWTGSFLNTYFQNDFPFQVFEVLYETKDVHVSIQIILELLGKRYGVDRVYIFQIDENNTNVSNTFEWCNSGIAPQIENFQNLNVEKLDVYWQLYNEEGVYCCDDIKESSELVYELCVPQGIKSLIHCALYNERVMTGFIGFDTCNRYHSWTGEEIASLGYISRILSVFLNKTGIESELKASYKNYMEMLDNLNGFVYVIDAENYQVIYVNNATRALGWAVGKICYKMAFGIDTPCENCPINKFTDDVNYAVEEIYSQILQGWVNSAASKLKWSGTKDAVLVCCTDISKYKK